MRKRRFTVKSRGRAATRILVLALALLLIAGAVWGAISLLKGREKKAGLIELPFGPDANYAYTGSGFLYFSGGKLEYFDIDDSRKNTSYRINTEELKITASKTISALYHDTAVQIVGATDSLVFSGRVISVKCGVSHVAVLREDSAGAAAIVVYDAAGVQTDQIDFAVAPTDFGFADAATDTLWTLELCTSGCSPTCTITTYDLASKRTTGVMGVQGQLVCSVLYSQNNLFISGTENLIRYSVTGNAETYRLTVYGWQLWDSSISSGTPMMLYSRRNEDALEMLRLYSLPDGDASGVTMNPLYPPDDALAALIAGGEARVFTPTEVISYSAAGKQTSRTELGITIDSAKKLSASHVLLSSGGKLYVAVY